MDFSNWFSQWLKRHPLKEPPGHDRERYTAGVMARITSAEHPAASRAPIIRWLPWPTRLVLAFATAVAGVAVAIGVWHRTALQVADSPASTRQQVVLAESPSSDEEWINETLQLLDRLGEALPVGSADQLDDESWMEELKLLDQQEEGAARS